MQRTRLRDPFVAPDAPGKFSEARVELVDVAFAPVCDLPVRADAELIEHSLDHRANADDELEIVRCSWRIEERRRCVLLNVDDDLPLARCFGARVGDLAKQAATVFGKVEQLWHRYALAGVGARVPAGQRQLAGTGHRGWIALAVTCADAIRNDNTDRERHQRKQRECGHGSAWALWGRKSCLCHSIVCEGVCTANQGKAGIAMRLTAERE